MLDLLFRGRTLVFDSALGPEEVTTRLQREIAPAKWRLYENRSQLFMGTLSDGRFWMMRLVGGKNSFRPAIEGQVSPGPRGARIDVKLRLPPLIVIFLGLLFTIGASVAMAFASDPYRGPDAPPAWYFALGLAVAAGGALVLIHLEARKATRLLADLFEAAPSRVPAQQRGAQSRLKEEG